MPILSETELYLPVKSFLEQRGYQVKGEIKNCDIVATSPDLEEPIIIELKKTFNLSLIFQGIDRLKLSDQVYLAVEKTKKKAGAQNQRWGDISNLCRMLGLGLMTVQFFKSKPPAIEVLTEPFPYIPRSSKKRVTRLLYEFNERSGDYNVGGSNKRKLVTVYREKALYCAYFLEKHEKLSPRQLKILTGSSNVSDTLQKNYYGWFERQERGIYALTPKGIEALTTYAHVIRAKIPVDELGI
ncbi:MAG TPA: DUF2161 family putative PD-(D/E)XK-type phosphodiesterase [Bacilli bacterium]